MSLKPFKLSRLHTFQRKELNSWSGKCCQFARKQVATFGIIHTLICLVLELLVVFIWTSSLGHAYGDPVFVQHSGIILGTGSSSIFAILVKSSNKFLEKYTVSGQCNIRFPFPQTRADQ